MYNEGDAVWRNILAGAAGYIGWWLIGIIGFLLMTLTWHDYVAVEAAMAFTFPMQIARLFIGLLCSFGAGSIVARVVRRRSTIPWIVAAILIAQFLPVHYHLWSKFPWWYHAFFLLTLAPALWCGSWWTLRFLAPPASSLLPTGTRGTASADFQR